MNVLIKWYKFVYFFTKVSTPQQMLNNADLCWPFHKKYGYYTIVSDEFVYFTANGSLMLVDLYFYYFWLFFWEINI